MQPSSIIRRWDMLITRLPEPLGNSYTRKKIYQKYGSKIGEGVYISRHVTIGNPSHVEIGDDCVISGNVGIDAWALTTIGNHVILGSGVTLLTGNHNIHSPEFEGKLLPIKIEDYVWVATNAMILGGGNTRLWLCCRCGFSSSRKRTKFGCCGWQSCSSS